jgi:hypothetical protein
MASLGNDLTAAPPQRPVEDEAQRGGGEIGRGMLLEAARQHRPQLPAI